MAKRIDTIDTPFDKDGQSIKEKPKKNAKQNYISRLKQNSEYNSLENASDPYDVRDAHYSAILQEYKEEFQSKRKQNYKMRNALFWSMLLLLLIVVVACCIALIIIFKNYSNTTTDIISIATIGISFISTIIVIPLTITKSLFPEKENDQIVGVLTKLIENDINIRTQSNEGTKNLKEILNILEKRKQTKKDD